MCIGNEKEITKYVLENKKFFNCCSYKIIYILLLIFGYFGAIVAWIFTAGSIVAVIWDILYSVACIIGTIGLFINNYYTIIVFLTAYIADVLIALVAIVIIITVDDLSGIIGDAEIDTTLLLVAFIFFTIAQTIFSVALVKIIRDIQAQTVVGLVNENNYNHDKNTGDSTGVGV